MDNQEEMKQPSPEQLVAMIDRAIKRYRGNSEKLKGAIGMLMIARSFGWKPMFLIHSRATIKDYEEILGVQIRELFPEEGPMAKKSVAWMVTKKLSNFWKAVKGEYPEKKTKSTELV